MVLGIQYCVTQKRICLYLILDPLKVFSLKLSQGIFLLPLPLYIYTYGCSKSIRTFKKHSHFSLQCRCQTQLVT